MPNANEFFDETMVKDYINKIIILRDNGTFRISQCLHVTSNVSTTYMLKINKSDSSITNANYVLQVYVKHIIKRYSSEPNFPIFNMKILLSIAQNSPLSLIFLCHYKQQHFIKILKSNLKHQLQRNCYICTCSCVLKSYEVY